MNLLAIRAELQRRTEHYLRQTNLVVDYYRIRRKLAYPWPLRHLPIPRQEVRGIANYPWGIWLSWEIEKRIGSLGWTGHLFRHAAARLAVKNDLANLASWPGYRPSPRPELCAAHLARTLATAAIEWPWVGIVLRRKILLALRRLVDETLPFVEETHGSFTATEQVLTAPNSFRLVHNISVISLIGLALAANVAKHSAATRLDHMVRVVWESILRLRADGYTEAVVYDGYLLDFVMDWLATLLRSEREHWLDRIIDAKYFEPSCFLSAPGDMMQVAELHDVEPQRMPFHVSALAKFHRMRPSPKLAWYLERCRRDWLRSDALAVPYAAARNSSSVRALPSGALDAHYASVLRTGWNSDDVAVVVGATNTSPSHIHNANGSLLIGTHGHWFITSPGYQQYMPTSEREFTMGPAAHNTPVINGQAQNARAMQRLNLGKDGGVFHTKIDLTRCYPAELKLESMIRSVWLVEKKVIVVADQIVGRGIQSIDYHWHGHTDAAWWTESNWARVHLAETTLWIHSPQTHIEDECVTRLRGSRGHLTLCARAKLQNRVLWWVFAVGEKLPRVVVSQRGETLTVSRTRFRA